MKILVDVLGAPETSGGMRSYAEELIVAWNEVAPDDELIVVGDSWVRPAFAGLESVTPIVVPARTTVRRILSQLVRAARISSRSRCDAVLSVSPIVTPFVPRRKRFSVVHDWRHLYRPNEFSFAQRGYRSLWKWTALSASAVFAISEKTFVETKETVPKARAVLAENGRDHSRRWPEPSAVPHTGKRIVVTFGHHSNKRPELVIRALEFLESDVRNGLVLVVLGAEGLYREQLRGIARGCGVEPACDFPGFTNVEDYQALVAAASVVALVSSDEGFGLPIAEAQYFGARALVTSDSGVARLHGAGVVEVDPSAEAVAAGLGVALANPLHAGITETSTSGAIQSWQKTAQTIRNEISRSIA